MICPTHFLSVNFSPYSKFESLECSDNHVVFNVMWHATQEKFKQSFSMLFIGCRTCGGRSLAHTHLTDIPLQDLTLAGASAFDRRHWRRRRWYGGNDQPCSSVRSTSTTVQSRSDWRSLSTSSSLKSDVITRRGARRKLQVQAGWSIAE